MLGPRPACAASVQVRVLGHLDTSVATSIRDGAAMDQALPTPGRRHTVATQSASGGRRISLTRGDAATVPLLQHRGRDRLGLYLLFFIFIIIIIFFFFFYVLTINNKILF